MLTSGQQYDVINTRKNTVKKNELYEVVCNTGIKLAWRRTSDIRKLRDRL